MDGIFLYVLNISIAASFLVLAILLFRVCFKRAPKWASVLLWGLVGLRLLFPFSIESALSLIPSKHTVPTTITHDRYPALDTGIEGVDEVINPILSGSMQATPEHSLHPMQAIITILGWIWLAGMIGMLLYMTVSFVYLRIKTSVAIEREDAVYLCDYVKTPFILGIIRPRLYLPSHISDKDYSLVVAHERAHLKRWDHIWKPLGFLLLSVYWFHPLIWIAYILLCKDIELSCDEKVIAALDENEKAAYAEALLTLGMKSRRLTACPLAFGEVSVKSRVSAIAKYKKPAMTVVVLSLIVCAIFAICFLTYKKNTSVAIEQGIWYAEKVIATTESDASCEDAPRFVFTKGGDVLVESGSLSVPAYVTLGRMHKAFLSKKEYDALLEGAVFREGYSAAYLHDTVAAVWRVMPSTASRVDCEEVYLLRSEKELFVGYAEGGKIKSLYKLRFNEILPTHLYTASYISPDITGASIILDTENKYGRVIFGNDMSYQAVGSYIYEKARLTLTTDDLFALRLVFLDVGDALVFSEKDSDIKGFSGLFPDATSFVGYYQLYGASGDTVFFDIDNDGGQDAIFVNLSRDGTIHYIVHQMGQTLANKTVPFPRYDCVSFEERSGALYLVCEYREGDLSKHSYRLSFDGDVLLFVYEAREG